MILAFYASVALPCGPDLPDALLTADLDHLASAPVAGFEAELDRLLGARPAGPFDGNTASTADIDERELKAAAPQVLDIDDYIDRRRAWASAWADPWRPGEKPSFPRPPAGLPAEFGLYADGAAAWHDGRLDDAERAFEGVLALPATQRTHRTLWATYMLGRLAENGGDGTAAARYAEVRRLVAGGMADPLGLATASYGREGRMALDRGDLVGAVHRYLDERANGGLDAPASLRVVAREMADRVARGDGGRSFASDADAAAVLTAWLVAHTSRDATVYTHDGHEFRPSDAARRWQAALEAAGGGAVGTDHLAWMAYQRGAWADAARFVATAPDTPVAHWIRGKLALRDGRAADAERELGLAAAAFPAEEGWPMGWWDRDPFGMGVAPSQAAWSEAGVLRVGQGRYTAALDAFYVGRDWPDTAYVAERVLTIDELKAWVDAHPEPPVPPPSPPPRIDYTAIPSPESPLWNDADWNWGAGVRALLARRLIRAGRFGEARDYLPDSLRPSLDDYAHAIQLGRNTSLSAEDRAKALWIASRIARRQGIDLLAYELDPDYAIHAGDFEAPVVGVRLQRADLRLDERARVEASGPPVPTRWTYRYVAAELAWESASLLPKDNDHRVRTLCMAGTWLMNSDPPAADRYYKEMVHNWNHPLAQQADRWRWFPDCGAAWPDETLPAPASGWCATVGWLPPGSAVIGAIAALLARRRRRA